MGGEEHDVSDPTDWINTSLSSLAGLDTALRCQVCKEFYDTPMITSCSHTFCSLCIRRCLSSDGKCPACRSGDQSSKLRRNWAVQECVDAFVKSRKQTLELARKGGADEHPKRKRRKINDSFESSQAIDSPPTRRTRSSARIGRQGSIPASQEVIALDSDNEDDRDYEQAQEEELQEPSDGLVACPMCNKRMKEEAVFSHLDRCNGQPVQETPPATLPKPKLAKLPQQQRISSPAKHLPHLNYSLLKDNALKKKLQELGIPTWGNRQLLIRRHTQWVDIFNANSDSPRPKGSRELLKDLDVWERTQGGQAPGQSQTGPTGVMRKDFDGSDWTGRHKSQFDDLVAKARAKRKTTDLNIAESNDPKSGEAIDRVVKTANTPSEVSTNDNTPPENAKLSKIDTTPKQSSSTLSQEISSSPVASMLHSAAQDVRRRRSIPGSPATVIPGLISTHSIPSTSSTPVPSSQKPVLNGLHATPRRGQPPPPPEQEGYSLQSSTEDSLPAKLAPTAKETKILPMFQVSEDPIHDVEGLGAANGDG